MRARSFLIAILATLLLTSRAHACFTRRMRKELVNTNDFFWNYRAPKTDVSRREVLFKEED